jgi:hypothetical protein
LIRVIWLRGHDTRYTAINGFYRIFDRAQVQIGGAQLALFALYRFRTGSRQLNCLAVEFAEAVLDWRQTQLDN